MGGKFSNEGRIEIYKFGWWNKICNWWFFFNYEAAKVVCRSLGLSFPTYLLYYGVFYGTSYPKHFVGDFRCTGTENSLEECSSTGASSRCRYYSIFTAAVVCGNPPVFHENITEMAGVITSPGYPSFMAQGDYRWTFTQNMTRGRVALYFEELDIGRHWGSSKVAIQESSSSSFSKEYTNVYRGKPGMVIDLSGQLRFYSPYTSNRDYGGGRGMRVRFLVYNEPEGEVHTDMNWKLLLSSNHYTRITANWTQVVFTGYDIIGFVMSCNSTQDWAKEVSYAVGESNSTSLTCSELIGYTHYNVHVLVQLRMQGKDIYKIYQSLVASLTTLQSFPRSRPPGLTSTEITSNSAVFQWQQIPRKDAHGVLLGYIVDLYSRYSGRYRGEIKTSNTSIAFKDLSPANRYFMKVKGYTAVGSGPNSYYYFSTKCGRTIENQLHGKIRLSDIDGWSITCIWRLKAPTPSTLVILLLESIEIPLSFLCKDYYMTITDGGHHLQAKLCGSRHSLTFVTIGSTEIEVYSRRPRKRFHISTSFFMLQNGISKITSFKSWKISSSTNNSTSINVNWEKYPGVKSVSSYVVICTANNRHRNISASSTNGRNLSLVVNNLLKYTEYKVVVLVMLGNSSYNLTNFNKTIFKSQEVMVKTSEDVPSKPPQNVTARYLGLNSVAVYWKPVDNEFTNGVVVGYYVYYQVAWTNVSYWDKEYISSDKTKAYLKNLKDVTLYRIEVSAATQIGEGPRSRGVFIRTGCHQTLSKKRGVFSTPNYPSNYPSNANCTWEISPPSSAGKLVVIFEHFDIEEGNNGICSNDFVKVFDKPDKVLSSPVCGQKAPFAVVNSAPRTTFISLKSDGGLEKSGFQAGYFFLRDKDRGNISLVLGTRNDTVVSLFWKIPSSSSIDWFYVLYKQDEVDENWKVVKTAALAVTIDGLLPSTPYIAQVIGNSSAKAYWSFKVKFSTLRLPTTPPPEETPSTEPTGFVKRMYSYGPSEGDLVIPNTWEYWHRCFKIEINNDGFLFITKRHYKVYVCRNGVLRFGSSSYVHWPMSFGTSFAFCDINILAPYWSLVDRQHSNVFYHVYKNVDSSEKSTKVLDQATSDVHLLKQNSLPSTFKASWVLVVTWDKLRHSTINTHTQHLRNTFQAVLITDGVFSFAMYNYPKNGIQWSAPTSSGSDKKNWQRFANDRGLPVVGWNVAACSLAWSYFNAGKSGMVNIGDIGNTTGFSVYWNQLRQMNSKQNNIKGKWFFELYLHWKVSDGEGDCKHWFKTQPDPRPFLEYLEPCPCTSRQAWFDERFTPAHKLQHWWKWQSNPRPCALSKFPSIDGWEQKCCYSHESGQWGALLVGHPNGGYSHRFSIKKWGSHEHSDVSGYKYCCIYSKLCHLFYQRRPSDDCSRYEPPEWSWMWGDPHFVTLDGKYYTFNGLGEYVMLDTKNGFFELQSRTRLAKGEGTATIFCAAVMKEYNCSTVQLNLEKNGSMSVLIDGEPLDLESLQNGSTTLNGSVAVARPQENSFKATYPSGIAVTLTESKGALSIVVALPKSFRNQTKGLLGIWNGNKSDDLTTPEGHVLPSNATGREIHFDFGQRWQVNETNSLFTYNANESVFTFSNTSFVPMFVDEIKFANKTLEKQALAECNGDVNCLFDAASTNDVSVGLDTKVVGSQLVNDSAILSNSPPKFPNYTSAILLTINVTKHLEIPVEDTDGDSVRFNVTGLPNGAIVKTNSSTVSVSWDVSMEKVNISFIATDTKGAVALLRPVFHLCACQNGAKCVEQLDGIQSQSDNRFTILSCECRSGYAGHYCENDVDACKVNLNPCYPGVQCKDLPAPANESGYECGPCPSGLTGKGDSCQDIDECQDGLKRCSKYCYNTPGSFICGCDDGYSLQNDGFTCQDINECQPLADCMQKCENTPGSYQCSCHNDFKMDPSDPKKCIPKFPCKDGSHGCQHVCFESNDVATCACHMGYQLKSDKKSCTDINECNEGKARCNQLCYNNEGSYDCGCVNGFRLSSNNVTCVDIDECIEWTFNCSVSLRCENTIGSYNCRCQEGLYWIDNRCRELSTGEKKPTPKPPPKPTTPSKEDLRNSVNVTIKEFNISEWTLQLDLVFKKGVAREATTFCAKNNICLLPKGRKRRSNAFITFTSNDVNLVGFPIQLANAPSGSMDALVAFYVKFPPGVSSNLSDSIDGAILVDIINGSLGNIGKDIGKTLLSVSRYQTQTSVTTETPVTTSAGFFPEDNSSLVYIIGGLVGGTIVLILLLGLIIRCCRKPPAKRSYTVQEGTNVEMSEYQQDGTFFQNPNAESKQ